MYFLQLYIQPQGISDEGRLSEMGEGNGVNADGPKPGPAHRERWLLRCPICFSDRNELYLGGNLGFRCIGALTAAT